MYKKKIILSPTKLFLWIKIKIISINIYITVNFFIISKYLWCNLFLIARIFIRIINEKLRETVSAWKSIPVAIFAVHQSIVIASRSSAFFCVYLRGLQTFRRVCVPEKSSLCKSMCTNRRASALTHDAYFLAMKPLPRDRGKRTRLLFFIEDSQTEAAPKTQVYIRIGVNDRLCRLSL